MTRRTTELTRQIRAGTIDHVTATDGKKYPSLMLTLKRFEVLTRADDAGSVEIDGYPTRSSMAGATEATGATERTTGDPAEPDDSGPDTGPERGATTLILRGAPSDAVRRLRFAAEGHLEVINRELDALISALNRFDALRSTAPVTNAVYDWLAASYGLPWDPIWKPAKKTSFKGYLARAWPDQRAVSSWTYKFTREHHRLPTETEMRQRLEREVILVHA